MYNESSGVLLACAFVDEIQSGVIHKSWMPIDMGITKLVSNTSNITYFENAHCIASPIVHIR